MSETQVANVSGFIREHPGYKIGNLDLEFLMGLKTPSVAEKATKLMRAVAKKHPVAGENFIVDYWRLAPILKVIRPGIPTQIVAQNWEDQAFLSACAELLPWLSISWTQDTLELSYLMQTYLSDASGYFERGHRDGWHVITPKGWSLLDNLEVEDAMSSIGFIAMWFDDQVKSTWLDAIVPAIQGAGYEAVRVDIIEHNNKIDDQIVAAIRRCRFVVADFTGQRGGVYFEAGLAQGLGKPVIWLCREDALKDVHFDTRQYNFIVWNPNNLGELKSRLRNRIEATIGRGP